MHLSSQVIFCELRGLGGEETSGNWTFELSLPLNNRRSFGPPSHPSIRASVSFNAAFAFRKALPSSVKEDMNVRSLRRIYDFSLTRIMVIEMVFYYEQVCFYGLYLKGGHNFNVQSVAL